MSRKVILEKRNEIDGRKCMIKSCGYSEKNGWVSIPENVERRKKFCEVIGVSSVQPGDRLCREISYLVILNQNF